MEDLSNFVKRLYGETACYYHLNQAGTLYSLKRFDTDQRGKMGVFGWVRELKRKNVFEISTYKYLGDKAAVTELADYTGDGMHYISKKNDPDRKGTGIAFYVDKASNDEDYKKSVKALKAIMLVMPRKTASNRGSRLALKLHALFSSIGIHGNTQMPEDIAPKGVLKGSLEHLMFITLSVAIDYQRDAVALWESSRKTYEDPQTAYLFDPESLHETKPSVIKKDMQKYGLSKKQHKDAETWRTIGVAFYKKWQGNPINFLSDCGFDAPEIIRRLRTDSHIYNGKLRRDYPFLRGSKIAPLWLRMLRDNIGIENIRNLDEVPIPVDIHIARATLATGIVRGHYSGSLEGIFEKIRKAWFDSTKGITLHGRGMIALDVDEPLWHLSKYGCTYRDKESGSCPKFAACGVNDFCVKGQIVIDRNIVRLDT